MKQDKVASLVAEMVTSSVYGEKRFLATVRELHLIGYGRMMQIIEREWYRLAQENESLQATGVKVSRRCLGELSEEEQREFVAEYQADYLFGADIPQAPYQDTWEQVGDVVAIDHSHDHCEICGEYFSESHYHCPRCDAVVGMYGHNCEERTQDNN